MFEFIEKELALSRFPKSFDENFTEKVTKSSILIKCCLTLSSFLVSLIILTDIKKISECHQNQWQLDRVYEGEEPLVQRESHNQPLY